MSGEKNKKCCHVVVTVHGMWGRPSHTESLAQEIAARGFVVMNSRANSGFGTYDGIEACAARLCTEVRDFIHNARQDAVTMGTSPPMSLSFVGYSAGGLFARAAVAQLHCSGYFEDPTAAISPGLLITIATPHLGIGTFESICARRIRAALTWVWGGRSMQEMCLADGDGRGNPPLLQRMAVAGSTWAQASGRFRARICYANALNDRTVPFETAAMRPTNPYRSVGNEAHSYIACVSSTAAPAAEQHREIEQVAMREEARARGQGWCAWALRTVGHVLLCVTVLPIVLCLVTLPMVLIVLPAARVVSLCTENTRRNIDSASATPEAATAVTSTVSTPTSVNSTALHVDEVGVSGGVGHGALAVALLNDADPSAAIEATDTGDECGDMVRTESGHGANSARAITAASGAPTDRYEAPKGTTLSHTQQQILPDICAQGWLRHEVVLPGPHTHGVIVHRRKLRFERPGRKIVAHVAQYLVAHLLDSSKSKHAYAGK